MRGHRAQRVETAPLKRCRDKTKESRDPRGACASAGGGLARPPNAKLENVEWAPNGVVSLFHKGELVLPIEDLAAPQVDASGVSGSRAMGDESTIAQVHPRKLVHALMRGARPPGARVSRRRKPRLRKERKRGCSSLSLSPRTRCLFSASDTRPPSWRARRFASASPRG